MTDTASTDQNKTEGCYKVTGILPVPHLSNLARDWQTDANTELYYYLERVFVVGGTDYYGMVMSAFFTKLISRNTTMPRVYDCATWNSEETARQGLPASKSPVVISMEHILFKTTTHGLDYENLEQLKSCLKPALARGSTVNSKQYWITLELVSRNYSEQKLFSQSVQPVQQPVGGTCSRKQSTLVTQIEILPEDEVCQVDKQGDKAERPPVFGHLLNHVAIKHAEQEGFHLLPDGESQEPHLVSRDKQFLVSAEQDGLPKMGSTEDGDLESEPDGEIVANKMKGKGKFLTVPALVLAHTRAYLDPRGKEELLMTCERLAAPQDPQPLLDADNATAHSLNVLGEEDHIDHQLRRDPDVHQAYVAPKGGRDNHQHQEEASQAPEGAQYHNCQIKVCLHQQQKVLGGLGGQYRQPHHQAGFPVLLYTPQEEHGRDVRAQARDMVQGDQHLLYRGLDDQVYGSLHLRDTCHIDSKPIHGLVSAPQASDNIWMSTIVKDVSGGQPGKEKNQNIVDIDYNELFTPAVAMVLSKLQQSQVIQVDQHPSPQEIQYPRFQPNQEYARVEQQEAAGDNWGYDGGGYHSRQSWQSLSRRTDQIVPELEVTAVDAPTRVDLVRRETSTNIKAVVCEKPVLGVSRVFLTGPIGLQNDKDKVSQEMETDVPQASLTAVGVVQSVDLGVGAKEASAQEQDDGVEGEAGTVETQEIHPGEDQLIGVPVEALDQIDDIRVPHVCEEFPHIVIEDRHDEHLQEECQQGDYLVFADMQVAKEAEDQDPEIEMSDKRYKVNTEASTVPALVLSNIRISGNDEGTAHGVGDGDSDYHHHPSEAVGLQSTGPQHDSRLEHQVEQGPLGLRDNLQVKVLKIKENTDTAYIYTGQNAPNIVLASNIARVVKIHMHNREQGLTVVIRNDIHSALHSTEQELHCGLQSMESHEVGQDGHSPVQNGQQGGVVCHTGQPQVVVHCPGEVGGHCHGEPRAYVHVGPLVGHHGVQVGLHQVREVQASPEDLHVVRLSAGDLRSHIQGPSVHRDGAPVDGLQCGDLSGDVGTVGAVEKGGGLVLQLKHPKSQGEPVTESVRLIFNVQLDRDSSASMEDLVNVLIFAVQVCPYVELFRPDIGLGQSEATAVLLSATEGQAPQIKRVHEIVYTNKEMEQVIAGEQGRQVHTALLNNLLCCHEPLQLAVQEPQRLSLRDHLQVKKLEHLENKDTANLFRADEGSILREDHNRQHVQDVVLGGVCLAFPSQSSSGWPEQLGGLLEGQESQLNPVCEAEELEAALQDQGPAMLVVFHHVHHTADGCVHPEQDAHAHGLGHGDEQRHSQHHQKDGGRSGQFPHSSHLLSSMPGFPQISENNFITNFPEDGSVGSTPGLWSQLA